MVEVELRPMDTDHFAYDWRGRTQKPQNISTKTYQTSAVTNGNARNVMSHQVSMVMAVINGPMALADSVLIKVFHKKIPSDKVRV